MKQKFKVLLLLLLVITLVLPVVPVRAESVHSDFSGAEYSLKQRQALSQMEYSWNDTREDFNIIAGKTKSVKLIFPEELDTNGYL